MKIQVKVFWVVTPCSVVVGYRRFGNISFPISEDEGSMYNPGDHDSIPHYTFSIASCSSSYVDPNILLSTHLSEFLNPLFYLRARDQASRSYKTEPKLII
jgi:hypothetical protein